jgi:hypothetical protein
MNKEWISIQAAIFHKHIEATHPTITSNYMPPDHTLIFKANITSSQAKNCNQNIDKNLCHCIITTCGDANAVMGTKHIDPSLCLYLDAYLMCIDNKHLKDKVPRGNGTYAKCLMLNSNTMHQVINAKLPQKENVDSQCNRC